MQNDNNNEMAVPSGYDQVMSPMDYPKLELKPGESFEGLVIDKSQQTFEKKEGDETVTYLRVEGEAGTFRVGESASLSKLVNEVQVNQRVWIHFVGEVPTGKASKMKKYKSAIKR